MALPISYLAGTSNVPKIRLEKAERFAIPATYLVVFLAYAALRIVNLSAIQGPREFPDTVTYVQKASWPLLRWGLHIGPLSGIISWWLHGRPPTVPFFYKLAGRDPWAIAVFQLGLSISCWGLLALFVARAVRVQQLKLIAFLFILLFTLSDYIIMWDGLLLSESISLSLMALFIVTWLWLLEGWNRQKVALMLATAFLWVFTRDTNAWVILMIAGVSAAVGSLWRSQGRYLLIAAILAVLFVGNEIADNSAKRWQQPFMNVIGKRVLPDPESRAYFAQLGMPVTPALMRLSGHFAWDRDLAFFKDPALQDFRDWLHTRGKSSYRRFLLAHPNITLGAPVRNAEALLTPNLDGYRPAGFSPILKGALAEVLYFKERAFWWMWTSGLLVGFAFTVAFRKGEPTWLVPLVLILLAYPHAIIIWHGDAAEVGRHALQVGVHFRLGLWILLFFAADMLVARMKKIICTQAKT